MGLCGLELNQCRYSARGRRGQRVAGDIVPGRGTVLRAAQQTAIGPFADSWGSEPQLEKTFFLEQAGQISGHPAVDSVPLAPHAEGGVGEDLSHLPCAPGSLSCPLSLSGAHVAQESAGRASNL